ncbi:hypothetical protein BGZ61DRAFT_556177 [Ilyonectria robusta]|uniref:uncharacterized protein n=1 Tax=Ilyonectria robusta TaxID=1079257 RepID=UPI001E8EA903|nr:uncharacterized protein BGZ61DRAFT_556177 [Ilyonectria robusta]KAH8672342.1 hypothetical protein BGZ61DRAFT_556177 [Ilyonectria robusta]
MTNLLAGVALITGAGSGIGQSTSMAFARHGVQKLALLDIDDAGLETTAAMISQQTNKRVESLKIKIDVSDEKAIVQAIQKVVDAFGRIDIAINNAGIGGPIMDSTKISTDEFRRVLDVNMIGLWVSQREEIRQMLAQSPIEIRWDKGVIVNMSSIFGLTSPSASTPAAPYNTSKHGVIAITRNDANSFAKDGIRINAICPGYVTTKNLAQAVTEDEVMRKELEKVPMGRLADPSEIAEAICFLASPMSSYMSGASLVIDGYC